MKLCCNKLKPRWRVKTGVASRRDAEDRPLLHGSWIIQDVQRYHTSRQSVIARAKKLELPHHVANAGPVVHVQRVGWLGLEERLQRLQRSAGFILRGRARRDGRAAFRFWERRWLHRGYVDR